MSDAAGKLSRKPGCKVEKKPIFSIVPVEAWSDKRLTLEQLRVLGAILSFCDKDRSAYPGRKAISTRSGVHIANVSSATSALERLGWLSKKGKGGFSKPSFYTIHVPQTLADQATVAESATVAQQATPMPLADQATVAQQATVADQATSTVAQQARGKELTSEQTITTTQRNRGSRLSADWSLPKTWGEWAVQEFSDWTPERVRRVADQFRDYWISKAGKDAMKTDWQATWRNWVRREAEKGKPAFVAAASVGQFKGAL